MNERAQGNLFLDYLAFSKEELLGEIIEDDDHLDDFIDENPVEVILNNSSQSWDDMNVQDKLNELLVKIKDKELKQLFKPLLEKTIEVFRKELPKDPAKLPPFELELEDEQSWKTNRTNKQATRIQSIAKQYEVRRFINKAIANNVIQPSQAESWSQILLTPKPNGSYRFWIDFRKLNTVSKSLGWPIPNISQMIQRIGEKKAKFFTVIDLTQGYYQIPISENSRKFTAFRTVLGLFEWLRLPMGLKGAGPYFQYLMQNNVLKDLIYNILEVYLDDIIIFAHTKEELVANTTKVLNKLKEFNIFVNPDKVKIGLTEVEYVGHIIDEHGLSFSPQKTAKVLDFRKPKSGKEMKMFLGLIQQFRDHVDHFGTITAPLYDLVINYEKTKTQTIDWTPELTKVFEEVQEAVANCPKIFFLDDVSPIFLHTDASNYGIGAYLFQVIDGKQYPIQFISKTLNKRERRWDTVEKESYAIFFACQKLKHLLNDKKFTIRTDSKNLTYLNTEHKSKVQRWKLAIQHLDFNVEHIPGKENIEADGFSRWVHYPNPEDEEELSLNHLDISMVEESRTLDKATYEKIKSVHGGSHGHNGVQRTLELLQRKGIKLWKGARSDIRLYNENCACCQKMNTRNIITQINPFTLATTEPMERIFIDTIGPLSSDENCITVNDGNNYILVIIDAFSRLTQCYPIKDTSANSALEPLLNWISNFGCPSQVVTDNATQFANQLINDFAEVANIDKTLIHAYSHEENGMVERANQEVIKHLTSMAFEIKSRQLWKRHLPLAQRIINNMVHNSIGISPNQIIFGNSINHDTHFLTKPKGNTMPQNYTEHVKQMLQAQERFLKIAQNNQRSTDLLHLAQRQVTNETNFPINSYVLAKYENKKPSKFHTNLHGPYRIISKQRAVYTVENLVTHQLLDFHTSLLREFRFDVENQETPEVVARHDSEYRGIKEILTHKFKND